jgi:hypothetical protein
MSPSAHLSTQTDPVFEMLYSLVFRMDKAQKASNSERLPDCTASLRIVWCRGSALDVYSIGSLFEYRLRHRYPESGFSWFLPGLLLPSRSCHQRITYHTEYETRLFLSYFLPVEKLRCVIYSRATYIRSNNAVFSTLEIHGVRSQNVVLFIVTAVKTSNSKYVTYCLTFIYFFFSAS